MRSGAVPTIALLVTLLGSGLPWMAGSAARAQPAHAYAGTIVFTAPGFPDATSFGGGTAAISLDGDVQAPLGGNEGLLGIDNQGRFYPDFATEVPTQANGGIAMVGGDEVVTLHLKPGLRWSDGSPITPADLVTFFVFALAPEINLQTFVAPIRSMTVAADRVVITYRGIYAPALSYSLPVILPFEYFNRKYRTAVPASAMASFDAARVAAFYASPAYKGSELQKMVTAWANDHYNTPADIFDGPYKLAEWADGQRVTEVPNPYYTALPPDSAHPRPAKIQFVVLATNPDSYALALTAGSTYGAVDLAEGTGLANLNLFRRTRYRVVVAPSLSFNHLELNQAVPALRDVRVRQALFYAIDRYRYIRALYPDLDAAAVRAATLTSILPDASPWSINRALPANPYDPARARALLTAAGYATRLGGPGRHLTLTLTILNGAVLLHSAALLQRLWGQVGVALRIQPVPGVGPNSLFASYTDGGIIGHRRFEIVQFGWSASLDPDQMVANVDPSQIPDASHPLGSNYAGIDDPTLLHLFIQAHQTLDDRARHRLYDQMQRYFLAQSYWIMLWDIPNVTLVKGTVGNFAPNPAGSNLWKVFRWYRASGA